MKSVVEVEDFARDVLAQSETIPVVVDFWAAWCGPCRILGPILEKLAAESAGAWSLAKVDTERFIEEATRYNIQSIPNVKMFHHGEMIAEFVGALPEYSVRQWLSRHLPGKNDDALAEARQLIAEHKRAEARALLEEILAGEAENAEARAMLATLVVFEDPSGAARLVEGIEDPSLADDIETVRTIARMLGELANPSALPDGATKDAYVRALNDLQERKFAEAVEQFIAIIRDDRYYNDDASRKACIALFRWLGDGDPVTTAYRREFSGALY